MFSWANKWENASFGRNKTSVEFAQKNLADVHCKFIYATPKQENFLCRKKNIVCQREFLKKIAQCRLKNISRGYFTTDAGN